MQCIAPWIPAFKNGLATENKSFVTFSFATIDSKRLIPRVRTCVYRGFLFDDESTNSIIFTTDNRSSKFDELLHNNNVEAVFYLNKSNKQFRFSGSAKLINPSSGVFPNVILPDIANKPYEEDEDNDVEQLSDEDEEKDIKKHNKRNNRTDYEEDDDDDDEVVRIGQPVLHKLGSTISVFKAPADYTIINKVPSRTPLTTETAGMIDEPLNYPLFSPSSLEKIQQRLESQPYNSLNELLLELPEIIYPPTHKDWQQEYQRAWDLLSSRSKSNFKSPKPKTLITEEKESYLIESPEEWMVKVSKLGKTSVLWWYF